ncbi:uncharacterized protein BO96DRAFT_90220 [Aspergillus niger CBS 101883]|uniref:uncharacterized protein n=1 Tax=Aspergillus lacticoffeatus (strain CBS 101883) TaxID=1450533 RepID=UPI000D800CAE|nr:uncharacterized protein BO96DRAFT_90220 [Aspergillus niger CBS 101883]PYH61094.1 hypothetical protein BO96DRAFT_90220 [Aspergillus niger CBS 101883]
MYTSSTYCLLSDHAAFVYYIYSLEFSGFVACPATTYAASRSPVPCAHNWMSQPENVRVFSVTARKQCFSLSGSKGLSAFSYGRRAS